MPDLFFYGTLCHAPLWHVVAGPLAGDLPVEPATLPGHAARQVIGGRHPVIVSDTGTAAPGVLVRGVSDAVLERLDFYEAGYGYTLEERTVETLMGPAIALVYFADPEMASSTPWSLADWAQSWGAITVTAAQEVMAAMGQHSSHAIARRYPSIFARAASRLTAAPGAPTQLRRRAAPDDIRIKRHIQPYANFFAVEEFDLSHRRFDGGFGPTINRAVFVSTDGATVLPYDPVRDRVLLIEQLRMGPYARGDSQPWSLEAIAGRIDPGETPEETVRREAVEEAGLTLQDLHKVASYYTSPGGKSEYIFAFVGISDLPDGIEGIGGVEGEGEDIRSHLVSFDALLDLVASGEIENAPLILTVQWLQLNRDRLRASP